MTEFGYNYYVVKDGDSGVRVGLLDQNMQYATGNAGAANSGTIQDGEEYIIRSAALFIAMNGVLVRNVKGTGDGGHSFGYRDDEGITAGYYVDGTNVCAWNENTQGFRLVLLIRDRDAAADRYRVVTFDALGSGGFSCFFYGDSATGGVAFDYPQRGWGRAIKGKLPHPSTGDLILRNNLSSGGSSYYYPFNFGASQTSSLTLTGLTPGTADPKNPYDPKGKTFKGGGSPNKQNFTDRSDIVTPDPIPTIGGVASGMVSIFSPSDTQLRNLADLLFSYNFFDWVQKNLQNLEEIFVSLGTVPFEVSTGSNVSVTWLGFDISQFTHPVYLRTLTEQYYEFDMGSISLKNDDRIHSSDSIFDYSPYSRLGIYLPFIGFQELDIDEFRDKVISLTYRIDVLSGTCIALIYIGNRCLYQFSGNCLTQIPMGSVDMSGIISNSVSIATAAASAGATSAVAGAGGEFVDSQLASGKLSEEGGNLRNKQFAAQVANANASLASTTANAMMGMKPNFKHSGAIGNSGSMMAVKQPYLYLTTPNEAVPEFYEKYCGLPSNITSRLGDLSGYTVVEDIRLNGLVATSPEVDEIYKLLKTGVII